MPFFGLSSLFYPKRLRPHGSEFDLERLKELAGLLSKTSPQVKRRSSQTFLPSCPSCGGHPRFPHENLGRTIPCPHCKAAIKLEAPVNLKMTCYFCKGHIEFPSHAAGRKFQCPHCQRDITLKQETAAA